MFLKSITLFLLVLSVFAGIFPPAQSEEYPGGHLEIGHVCNIFHFPSEHHLIKTGYYFNKIMKRLNTNLECPKQLTFIENKHVALTATHNKELKSQAYEIIIDAKEIKIVYGDYSGYVYALESLSQLIKRGKGKVPLAKIADAPLLEYRGIMIDSARHYLSVDSIIRVIKSMPLSKLNILHWHIVDDESFPLQLVSHPELAQYSRYSKSQVYTSEDVSRILNAASLNAVQVIPEIDTPAHVRAWGQAPAWKSLGISIPCAGGTGYNGQLDVSIPQVFDLVKDVIKEVSQMFASSPYIHLGGDQVSSACWNKRPAIQDFMQSKNLSSYGELQMYWRDQIKSVLPANRRAIFWRNDAQNVITQPDDVLHYWGSQADVAKIAAGSASKIILSPSDILYINKGQGNLWLNATQGTYSVWKNIYDNFTVFPQGLDRSRIMGAQVTLWGEVSNEDTLENNLWMRSSAFAARVWSEQKLQTYEIVTYLVQLQYTLYDMDVDASPITSEFCQRKPIVCFPPPAEETVNISEM